MKNRKRMVSILAGIMAAVMILTLIAGILPAASASSSEIRKQINALKQEREDIKLKVAEVLQQYEANSNEIADIISRKNVIDQEIGLLHQEISNINDQISAYSVLIADRQDELDQAEVRFEAMNADCKVRIRAMEEEGALSYWEVLFNANSFSDLLDRLNMVEEIASSDNRRLQELSDAARRVEEVQLQLQDEKAELQGTKDELDAAQASLDVKKEQADALLIELLAKAKELNIMQEDLEQQDQDILEAIAIKEQEYNEAKEMEWIAYMATMTTPPTEAPIVNIGGDGSFGDEASSGSSTSTGSGSSVTVGGSWIIPCNYTDMSSAFGMRESPTAGASTYHQGVDLRAPAGTPIYASRGGTVTQATFGKSAGYYVTINHGDGFSSIYMHMTNYVVRSGQQVNQGEVIGYVGKTGVATGNHLHFGIALNGAYVNPCSYVGLY